MSARDPISTSLAQRKGVTVLTVIGDIDMATAPALQAAVDGALDDRPRAFVIDLLGVDFLGSVGLQILVAAQEKLSTSGRLAVVADGPATSRPIRLTRLDEVLSLFPTLDEAVEAVRAVRAAGPRRQGAAESGQP